MPKIYLDHAAATPVDPRVLKAMTKAAAIFGNPSAFNYKGREARIALEKSRAQIAKFLNVRPDEIIFTASGSEANNLVLQSFVNRGQIITTPIEHKSVLEVLNKSNIKFVPVDGQGIIDLKALAKLLRPDSVLVSIMYANNEIGSIQPIPKISKLIRNYNREHKTSILFHVDACQAAGLLDMNVQHLGADFVSFNSSKLYGPHGLGVLYVRRGLKLKPLILGGDQEFRLRAGTENVSAIVGLAKAISLIKPSETKKIKKIRDYGLKLIKKEIPEGLLVGPEGDQRLANNINICIPELNSEQLLLELDRYGIAAGSGSACTSHTVEPSHVLRALKVPAEFINGAIRFSLGRETKIKDLDYTVRALKKIICELRNRYSRN